MVNDRNDIKIHDQHALDISTGTKMKGFSIERTAAMSLGRNHKPCLISGNDICKEGQVIPSLFLKIMTHMDVLLLLVTSQQT
jgi:hypothetical protein